MVFSDLLRTSTHHGVLPSEPLPPTLSFLLLALVKVFVPLVLLCTIRFYSTLLKAFSLVLEGTKFCSWSEDATRFFHSFAFSGVPFPSRKDASAGPDCH